MTNLLTGPPQLLLSLQYFLGEFLQIKCFAPCEVGLERMKKGSTQASWIRFTEKKRKAFIKQQQGEWECSSLVE